MQWDAKTSQAQREAAARYDADNTKQFRMKLNIKTDADILEWLAQQPNKQGSIKRLIRADILSTEGRR